MEPLCKPLNDLTREHAFGSGEARVPDHNAIRSVFSPRCSRDRAHRCSPQKYGGYNGRCIKVIKPRDLWPLLSRLCFCCLWTLSKIQQVPPRCGDKARHDDVGPKREKLCLATEHLVLSPSRITRESTREDRVWKRENFCFFTRDTTREIGIVSKCQFTYQFLITIP